MCGHAQTLESGPHTLELQCVVSQRLWLQCLAGQRLEATHWTSSVTSSVADEEVLLNSTHHILNLDDLTDLGKIITNKQTKTLACPTFHTCTISHSAVHVVSLELTED